MPALTAQGRKERIALLFERVITHGELELTDEIFAPDFTWPQFGLHGPGGVRTWVRRFRAAFPDVVDRVREQYCDGDVVVTRVALTGTQHGPYLGMPPTGRRAEWSAVGIDRFRDDLVVERTALFDPLDLMRRLGHDRIDLGG